MSSPEDKLKELLYASTEMQPCAINDDAAIPMDQFSNWFVQQFNKSKEDINCKLDNFAIYFINTLRQQTEIHLRSIESEQNFQTSTRTSKSTVYNIDPDAHNNPTECTTPKRVPLCTQNSAPSTPNFASTPEQVGKAQNHVENSLIDDLSTANFRNTSKNISNCNSVSVQSMDRNLSSNFRSDTSTPIRRNQNTNRRSGSNSLSLAVTPHSTEKSTRNNHSVSSSFCLGDFMVLQQSNNRSNRKKTYVQSQNTTAASLSDTPTSTKPKKRVVPTTISQRSVISGGGDIKPFGCSSSFSNENNILKLTTNVEIDDKNKCSIMAARRSLKLNAVEISKELETLSIGDDEKNLRVMIERKLRDVTSNVENEASKTTQNKQLPRVEFDKIKNCSIIQRLADIYVVLMDLNFVTNILSEMAFILNLLNAEETTTVVETSINANEEMIISINDSLIGMELLNNCTNSIYFALCVLRRQRHILAQLDLKSLGVVLNNERIQYLDMNLKSYLETAHHNKQSFLLGKSQSVEVFTTNDHSFKSVYYHEEKDSRQHFTSNNEFGAFKTQRDLFYKVIKLWETHHLNHNWNFTQELAPKIREIFKQSENPINMAHFAKLFVSQLLISASDASSPEDIGLDVDAEKFSKLSQRFVAPSNFSVDYQFPRNQAFFRDFINEARSIPFIEQLKMALYHQLITLNNSTFEQLNLFSDHRDEVDEFDTKNDKSEITEFVVRPEILASMIILAKFLGYVTAYPYSQNLISPITLGTIEKKQLALRSLFQPHFNVCQHLLDAIKNNKMLITLPWLVQYLAMLDNITLQMEDLENTTNALLAIYTQIAINLSPTSLLPISIFILRCCIGWLFDTKPIIAEKYFRYRADFNQFLETDKTQDHNAVTIFRATYCRNINENQIVEKPFNPMLERLLPVACPFLAEFRVAIMPSKYATTKLLSRTGRYRHITTRIAETVAGESTPVNSSLRNIQNTTSDKNNDMNSQQNLQKKLTDAFLHSQNASMRRLIEFITERVYKSVIKDGQRKYIVPTKANADKCVNKITSSNADEVSKMVSNIYKNAHEEALHQWEINLPTFLDERITTALNALLPTETTSVIKRIYFKLIHQNAMKRIQQWFNDNLRRNNLYCNDLNEITQKICKANKKEQQQQQTSSSSSTSSELKIIQLQPCVSDLLDELQYWLHCTSIRTELLQSDANYIISFLQRIPETFVNTLPMIFYRIMGTSIIQLMQHIIIHKPEWITIQLLNSVCTILLHPKFETFIKTDEQQNKKGQNKNKIGSKAIADVMNGSNVDNNVNDNADDDDDADEDSSSSTNLLENQKTSSIFDGLITVAFIEALGVRSDLFEKLKDLLVYMIKQNVITYDKVNILFMPILRDLNIPINVMNEISKTLQLIVIETT